MVYGEPDTARVPVAKLEEKLPVTASIAASCVTPFKVIETLPEGTKDPALIVPLKVVGVSPKVIVGPVKLLKTAVAFCTVRVVLVSLALLKLESPPKL